MTKHDLRCASVNCKASAPRIMTVDPFAIGMPADVLARRADGEPALRCSYCGFVWFKRWNAHSKRSTPIAAGYYDEAGETGFQSVPLTHPTRC
jgi:hypothetical protein